MIKIEVDLCRMETESTHAVIVGAVNDAKHELLSNATKVSDLVSPIPNVCVSFRGEQSPTVTRVVDVKALKTKITQSVNSIVFNERELLEVCSKLYPEFSDDLFAKTMPMYAAHVDRGVSKEEFLSFVLREE